VKLFGSYELPRRWTGKHALTLGIGLTAESGAPVTPLGEDEDYGSGEVFLLPRGVLGRTPWYVQPDLFFEWAYQVTREIRVSFNAVVFNFLNLQEPLRVDQVWTFDFVCPLRRDPARTPQAQLAGLTIGEIDRSTGACVPSDAPVARNPNFGSAVLRQPPTSARLGLKMTF
jgi:hypothetical protein